MIVALRTEISQKPEIFAMGIRMELEDSDSNIVQVHMTGRPPYDVSRVAYNGTEVAVYRNTPELRNVDLVED
jgi:hypothetical protein